MRVVHVWDRAGLPWASAPGCTGTVTVTVGAARRLLRGGHVERRAMRGAPARFQGVALPECVRRGPQRQLGVDHAFFGPGTTVEPFCRLEKLGDRPIFTCLQT